MYKVSIFGIPAHPMANDMPAALLPASLICDTIALLGGDRSWARSGYHTMLLGTVSALAAGALGALDAPLALAREDTRPKVTTHILLNTGVAGLFGWLTWQRSSDPDRVSAGNWLLSLLGNMALNYSAWNGYRMVYHDGLRVGEEAPMNFVEVREEPARVA